MPPAEVDGGGGDDGDGWFDGRIDLVDDYGNWMADHSFGFYTWAGEGLRSGLNGVGVSDGALADASDATLLVGTTAAATAAVLVGKAAIAAGPAATAAYLATEVAESGFEYLTGIPVIFGIEDVLQFGFKRGAKEAAGEIAEGGVLRGAIDLTDGAVDRTLSRKRDAYGAAMELRDDIDPDGMLDVVGHGLYDDKGRWVGIGDSRRILRTPDELADVVRRDPKFDGQDLRMLVCRAGKEGADGGAGFMQKLADLLGVTVVAPDVDVLTDPDWPNKWKLDPGDGSGMMRYFLGRKR